MDPVSVTLKGTKALILPIIISILISGGSVNINTTSKSPKVDTSLSIYNQAYDIQNSTLDLLSKNDYDLSKVKNKEFKFDNKAVVEKLLNKTMSATITTNRNLLKPIILDMIYKNSDDIKIIFDLDSIDEHDVDLVGGCIELENGGSVETGTKDGIECGLLTGSVVLNRAYYCDWCPDNIKDVLYQKGQYASHTVKNLNTVKIPKKVRQLAEFLLVFGPICPEDVIYQSQNPNLGKKLYKKIKTHSGYEYFAYG